MIIGNKSDRFDREVLTKTGQEFAQQNGIPFMETSAKNASNIDVLFSQLAKALRDIHAEDKLKNPSYYANVRGIPNTVTLTREPKKKKGICCT